MSRLSSAIDCCVLEGFDVEAVICESRDPDAAGRAIAVEEVVVAAAVVVVVVVVAVVVAVAVVAVVDVLDEE